MFLMSRFSTCPSTNNDAARPLLRGSGPKIEALIPYCANLEPSSIQLLLHLAENSPALVLAMMTFCEGLEMATIGGP